MLAGGKATWEDDAFCSLTAEKQLDRMFEFPRRGDENFLWWDFFGLWLDLLHFLEFPTKKNNNLCGIELLKAWNSQEFWTTGEWLQEKET